MLELLSICFYVNCLERVKMKRSYHVSIMMMSALILALLFIVSCGSSQDVPPTIAVIINTPAATSATVTEDNNGYPAPTASSDSSGYPGAGIAGLSETPPDVQPDLPVPEANFGSIGGVLVREISGEGFIPLTPVRVSLAEVKLLESGEPGFLAYNDDSQDAELPGTGIGIFNRVSPGRYGLVIEMGFTQLLALDENGETLIFELEAGQILDLGQIFVNFD
ncbi:MAG: hypothetical protein KDE28_12145 [Anaerolineales bacterium]|nr:hypothetical protein [Anaerolineales bacterium]